MNIRPIKPLSWLLLLPVLSIGTACASVDHVPNLGKLVFEGDVLVVPLVAREGQPMVTVDVGDGNKYRFIVDTGAGVNVMDSSLAKSMGFKHIGEMEIGAPGGPQIPADIVVVPTTYIGDALLKDAEFVTMDIVSFSGGMIHGVVGLGVFRDYVLTYDQPKGEIRVNRGALASGDPGVSSYNNVSEHIQVDMDVAGTTIATHIDTGSMAGFTLPIEVKGAIPLVEGNRGTTKARVVGGDRDVEFAKLDGNIVFANTTYKSPDISFMDPSPGYGNVGSQILADYVISIDQKNHFIRFEKVDAAVSDKPLEEPRRLGVQFRGTPGGSVLTIGKVFPNSLAEQAGLKSGDVLIALNDKPSQEYDMASLGALFRGSKPLSFEVDRKGELITIGIQ